MSELENIQKELKSKADPERAKHSVRYFKTGPGEYGEGDVFLGLKVPDIRKIVRKYSGMALTETEKLLHSKIHGERQVALLIWVNKFQKGDAELKKKIFDLYLKNTKWINNWDLVDLSAPKIVSQYLLDFDKKILYSLARSKNIWERRIAIMGTAEFIRNNQFNDTLKIAEMLLSDEHDLIHKAVGWMLREVGKRSFSAEEKFLTKYAAQMPRTMLRYAIEKFPEPKRKRYLAVKFRKS